MTSTHPFRIFSLAEIQHATKSFDDKLVIGHGGFGRVFKGYISSEEVGHVVAIKRLDSMSKQGEVEFRAEIDILSTLRHSHLVSLIGYCHENKEMILVYEYMPNGTLYHHLHKAHTPLSWVTRLKIAIGAARGLDYLHTGVGTLHGIIHRDVKTSNILLDENWAAMVSDFGLSKIGPTNQLISYVDASVKGTFGYLDPEYFYTRNLTRKTDVYAFGVVLFELLSGRLPVDEQNGEEQCSLVRWAQKCVKDKKLDQMVDSTIKGTVSRNCLKRFAKLADHCVNRALEDRPTMTEVVASLEALLKLQEKSEDFVESSGNMGFHWKMHKYFASNSNQRQRSLPKSLGNMSHYEELMIRDLKKFKFCELDFATRNFGNDTFLGEGSYGKVYRGWVDKTTYSPTKHTDELPVVIKKLDRYTLVSPEKPRYRLFLTFLFEASGMKFRQVLSMCESNRRQFLQCCLIHYWMQFDLKSLKDFRHPNLVKLIGYCLESGSLYLVHEFMPKGNFKDLLYSGSVARLPLVLKVKILLGLVRVVYFLQNHWLGDVRQTWLDRHMILLDEDFTPKLSDCDVGYIVNGHGDYVYDTDEWQFMQKCNLSRFEVIVLEVLIGKRINSSDEVMRIDGLYHQSGNKQAWWSWHDIAKSCYELHHEVDIESRLLTLLKEHSEFIQRTLKK